MSTAQTATIEADLAFAIRAAHAAGQRLLSLREAGRWEDAILGDVGDQAADGYLNGFLEGRYPDDGVLSEETADSPARLAKSRCWIVDPLDGTKEYRGLREDWAVHVALVVDGAPALGAVALPSVGTTLWGVCVPGEERAGIEGSDAALARGDSAAPEAGPRIVVSRSHTPPWVEAFAKEVGASSLEGWGSAGFKTGHILLGQADCYVHKIGLKEWDTCAPEAVARSLGWHVCKLRGDEHRYNQANPKNHELVVCRPSMKDAVVEALARSGALEDER